MLFIYLSIFSILGISIIVLIELRKTKKTLLQILKKLCNIDSIRFENKLEKIHTSSLQKKKTIYLYWNTKFSKIKIYVILRGEKIRSFIRKKLHPETETSETSHFIKKIKGDT